MNRLVVALLLVGTSALPAAAQRMAPDPLAGVARPANQDFASLDTQSVHLRPRVAQGAQAERIARSARQAQFNRHFPGTPIRVVASRRQ